MNNKIKKIILNNLPYGIITLFAMKIGVAWRLAEGITLWEKIENITTSFATAFKTAAPSLSRSGRLLQKRIWRIVSLF